MSDWMQAYGQIIGVVVGGGIAGTVAIVLGSKNNRASDARLDRQFIADRERESDRVRRERREELYVQTSEWLLHLEGYTLLGLRLAYSKLSYSQYLDEQISQAQGARLQIARMNMLREIYGSPETAVAYLAVTEARNSYNLRIHEVERLAQSGAAASPAMEGHRATLDKLCTDVRERGRLLLDQIAKSAVA